MSARAVVIDVGSASRVLVAHIGRLAGFSIVEKTGAAYDHVGAALSDAVLQSGINYRSVVWPRVAHILDLYPKLRTSPEFYALLRAHGAKTILNWKHEEKPRRLTELTRYCVQHNLVSCEDIAEHVCRGSGRQGLLAIRGIGPKTIDYLSGLLGIDAVAVDRHIFSFLRQAGVETADYQFVRRTVVKAAELIGISGRSLDYSIWAFGAAQRSRELPRLANSVILKSPAGRTSARDQVGVVDGEQSGQGGSVPAIEDALPDLPASAGAGIDVEIGCGLVEGPAHLASFPE